VCVVPNGLDPRLTAASADRDAVRSQLDIPCQAPVVAFVGKNARHKGLPLLERIFRRVLDVRPDAHLILIGEGLTNAWVQDSFGFHRAFHGLGTRDDVYDLIGAADCLVLTSTSEGFPNAVLEAMVLGVPPVATRVGECPIMIDHGVSGYLFDYDDDAEGARLLLDLINDPAKLAALSQQARSVALERYGTKAMVDRTLDIYERALGRRLRTAPAVPEAS
jgi:glycosyltransferase involved in cell wall biosynthesis